MSSHTDPWPKMAQPRTGASSKGFTLIEILVVMVLISLVTAFTIPSIRTSLFSDQLKATARRLVGIVTEVSQDAVSNRSEYVLNFDLEQGLVWASSGAGGKKKSDESGGKKFELDESVRIVDITSAHSEKSSEGTTTLRFSKKGYVDKTAIHLRSDDGRDMTIVLSPFMGVVKVFDTYVDLEDERVRF